MITRMVNRLRMIRWTRTTSSESRRRRRQSLWFETLELRATPSADLTALLVDSLADYAIPGQSLAISTTVKNVGADSSQDFNVEYRLSSDQVISNTDLLLGTSSWQSLEAGEEKDLPFSVTIPAGTAHGSYYVGVIVLPNGTVGDTITNNNALADSNATDVLLTELTGTVVYNGSSRTVSIRSAESASLPIYDDRTTWIVIHGRNSSPSSPNLETLADAIDGYPTDDQVLVLDWSSAAASGLLGGAGENYIKPVATWAASALTTYGVDAGELNLAGHSWGAYVAAELAERVPGAAVQSIIALDPAVDYPGGSYNPTAKNEVNFARNSNYSWAFYAYGGSYGSATTAKTADEAFVVTGTDHSKLVNVVADLVTMSYAPLNVNEALIGSQFQLDRLLTGQRNTIWVANKYDSTGKRVSKGTFEAVVQATGNGLNVYALKFYDGNNEVVYYA